MVLYLIIVLYYQLTSPKQSKEDNSALQQDDTHNDEVDGTRVDVFVNLGGAIGKINIVSIHSMLQRKVHQSWKDINESLR